MGFSRQEYWSGLPFPSPGNGGSHFLLPTQGSNPGLLHCGRILYPLSHQGNPWWEHCNSPLTATFNHSEQYCQLQSLWPLDLQTLIVLELKVCSFWLTYVRLTHPQPRQPLSYCLPELGVLVSSWVRSYCICFSLSDISLSMMLSRSIRDGEHGRISFFLGLNHILLHKTALPCKLQSSIKGLIKGCFWKCLGDCESCCNECSSPDICSRQWFYLFQIKAQ